MEAPELDLRVRLVDDVVGEQRAKRLDKLVTVHAQLYSQGRDYTNFILVAGYAAFFALWSGMAGDIASHLRLWSGGLMGVSLLLFISWELVVMYNRMLAGNRLATVLAPSGYPDDFEARWDEAATAISRRELRSLRLWPYVFFPSVVTGLTGAAILGASAFIAVASPAPKTADKAPPHREAVRSLSTPPARSPAEAR